MANEIRPVLTNELQAAATKALHTQIENLNTPVLVIPAGFPGAEAIRQNVADFLKKNSSRVMHLIMLLHDQSHE